MDREQSIAFAKKYLEDVISFFGANLEVHASAEGDVIQLAVPNTYLSNLLIGRNGETLHSLQTLTRSSLIVRNAELQRVNIDVADYKKRHNNKISERAEGWAQQVMTTGEAMILEPMNPADRFVVHKVLADYEQLSTDSEGEGHDRHIVIKKK
ncbi:MAG: R3H domain-containing nucleic acid-binding protein [Candidatus Nanoperiomorbaceae bacterium]